MKQNIGKIFYYCMVLILVTLVFGTLSGCSSKSKGLKGPGGELSEADLNYQRESRYQEGSLPTAEGEGLFRDVHFGFDSSTLNDTARQNIEYNIQILETNPRVKVQLEGHCDERGTAEYNLALGARRAQAVEDMLAAYGIDSSRLSSISYGEEVPLDPGKNELAWVRNRRVHFSGYTQ